MKFVKVLSLCVLMSPSAFADRLQYKDNKGLLYCEMICKVAKTEHKVGMWPKNSQDYALKVRGRWVSEGWTITGTGKYEVSSEVLKNASERCEDLRSQLIRLNPIRGLLESSDISGITEKSCKIYPRITTEAGLLVFEMFAPEEDETDL